MSFQSLIAHNGVTHQKSKSVEHPQPSTTENETENLTTTEIQTTQDLTSATLVTGFGESIFTLLIASPFLWLGFKKWLHR